MKHTDKKHVLVINDTQEILDLFRTILEDEGDYHVTLSSFPLKVKEVAELNPDLIILDYMFGEQKLGWQMLQMLKMSQDTSQIPIIICTVSIQDVRDQEGYLTSKGVHVVFKPFDVDDLLSAIEKSFLSHNHLLSNFDNNSQKGDHSD